MTDLDALAKALRTELGAPPEAWQRAQRERVRQTLGTKPQRRALFHLASVVAAALVVVCALVWVTSRNQGPVAGERRFGAEALAGPIHLEDGSSIVLAPGGRGRLVTDATAVRFELTAGRADFDVVPGQKRTFAVTAGKNEVTVVGTRFSVAYEPKGAFEVDAFVLTVWGVTIIS
jgi:ferric-dicitrate binding protein FerR (iron transport regulator)